MQLYIKLDKALLWQFQRYSLTRCFELFLFWDYIFSYYNNVCSLQVIKNLVFIARCAHILDKESFSTPGIDGNEPTKPGVKVTGEAGDAGEGSEVNRGRDFSVLWLVRKMVREAHHEAITNTKRTLKVRPRHRHVCSFMQWYVLCGQGEAQTHACRRLDAMICLLYYKYTYKWSVYNTSWWIQIKNSISCYDGV